MFLKQYVQGLSLLHPIIIVSLILNVFLLTAAPV